MRLYLSSYGIGNKPDELIAMVHGKRAAVIANACDHRGADIRAERLDREFSDLQALGFEPTEIDLRDYFDGSFSAKDLENYDLVWVRGGNVFNLVRAMKQSGFDKVITELLKQNRIAYGGYSAGCCALSPTLHGVELCDPSNDIPEGYPSEIIWDGLGLIDYSYVPHYKSDHPESPMIDDVVAYLEKHKIPYRTFHDGDVAVVNG